MSCPSTSSTTTTNPPERSRRVACPGRAGPQRLVAGAVKCPPLRTGRAWDTIAGMFLVDAPIMTERLLLRPFREDDLDALHEIRSIPEILRFTYWPVQSREDTRAVIAQRRQMNRLAQEGDVLVLAVETRRTHRLIGDVDLTWTSVEHRQGEVGVTLHPEGQGKGYAQEAVAALLRLAFEDLDLHRVVGRTDARNSAAAACLRRLGMRQEAHFHHCGIADGEWYDELVYALLADEWAQRR
jgi:RimJ/RimL family protein N-acetyltransferase